MSLLESRIEAKSLWEARLVLADMAKRFRQTQQQVHNRIMLRQLASDQYEPAPTPLEVTAKLREQLGRASAVQVLAGKDLPER
eukprot:1241464-Prymnesium_polylepis.1